jgi:hypothetical protein
MLVFDWMFDSIINCVQIGILSLLFVLGFLIGGCYIYGGTPKNIILHLGEMSAHFVSQISPCKTEPVGPHVRSLKPPSTHHIPVVIELKD